MSVVDTYHNMLDAGTPHYVVKNMVQDHLASLARLKPSQKTPQAEITTAITELTAFLKTLNQGE